MLVGPTASGKTAAWRVLLEALAATLDVKARTGLSSVTVFWVERVD
jgi:hypothetical protein